MATQTFIGWSRRGVLERLLVMAQQRGIALSLAFLDGTSIRAHQKAAGGRGKIGQCGGDVARHRRGDRPLAGWLPAPRRA